MEDLLETLIPTLLLIGSVLFVGFGVTLGSLFYFRRRSFEKSTYKQVTQERFLKAVRDKGIWGEYLTTRQLEKVGGYGKFVMNTYIPKARGKGLTEIDVTFIHESGITSSSRKITAAGFLEKKRTGSGRRCLKTGTNKNSIIRLNKMNNTSKVWKVFSRHDRRRSIPFGHRLQ